MLVENLNEHSLTKELGGGTLLGVPIMFGNGENYGTLCGIDKYPQNRIWFYFNERIKGHCSDDHC
ncbi:hypothetical protein ACM26V_14450 [Salipaludibacillus sp. HK11]|uniref:hypothetical protein n=1 Tax=Salipaludibacillus sp. HK11 TaxID=3394320 RepID=UPI0039FBCACA